MKRFGVGFARSVLSLSLNSGFLNLAPPGATPLKKP